MSTPATQISTTLGELLGLEQVLRRVSEQDGLSAKAKYHAVKLANLVKAETKHFYAQQADLFKTLGTERATVTTKERQQYGPTLREIPPDKHADYQGRIQEICAVPVTIAWAPMRSIDLPNATAADLIDLGPLCELVEPKEDGT